MSKQGNIVWIDDNPRRKRTAVDLDKASKYNVDFRDVHNGDLTRVVGNLLDGSAPALVILDHILDQTATANRLLQRGSTIAEAIKERWPACPVIGVTNAEIDVRTKRTYDDLLPFTDFGRYFDCIDGIADSFARIVKNKARTTQRLLQLLNPPEAELERLEAALPGDLKRNLNDGSVASRFYDWIQSLLLTRPGFIYDSLWTATLLGLSETGFSKVENLFTTAAYTGVFAGHGSGRWWQSILTERLYALQPPGPGELSWHVGRRLATFDSHDFSRCYICKNEFPETVAFLDSSSAKRRQAHDRCTVLHPKYKRELYFEDIRMMRG